MELDRIERGWAVYSEDGKRVGDVVEVHPHYILVSRGLLVVRDVYVPRYAVGSVEERRVVLAIPDDRLRRMAWNTPPPEPPEPADAPTPRLVPSAEEEQDNLFSFGAETAADELTTSVDGETTIEDDYAYTPDEGEPEWDDYEDMGILFGSNVEIDGEVYLATQRLGDGPPIVFVHGWGCDRRIWDYLTLDLPNDYTVVTYDGRGYGRSTAPWVGYEVARMSHDLRVVLRTLDLTDATIVGLDLGAAAALHYALDGGRRVGRLVLIAPAISPDAVPVIPPVGDEDTGDDGDDTDIAAADVDAMEMAEATDTETTGVEASAETTQVQVEAGANGEALETGARTEAAASDTQAEAAASEAEAEPVSVEAAADAEANQEEPETTSAPVDRHADWRALLRHDRPRLASEVAAAWAPDTSAETAAWLRDGFLSAAPYALTHGLDALDAPDLPRALSDVTLPVTVLHPTGDPFIPPEWSRQLADAIPGSRLIELDMDGHLPMVLDPARIAHEIRAAMEQESEASC